MTGFALKVPALPPDVRRGLPRRSVSEEMGLCPSYGLWPINIGQSPNHGHSPNLLSPVRQGKALPHIRRQSRAKATFEAKLGGRRFKPCRTQMLKTLGIKV